LIAKSPAALLKVHSDSFKVPVP